MLRLTLVSTAQAHCRGHTHNTLRRSISSTSSLLAAPESSAFATQRLQKPAATRGEKPATSPPTPTATNSNSHTKEQRQTVANHRLRSSASSSEFLDKLFAERKGKTNSPSSSLSQQQLTNQRQRRPTLESNNAEKSNNNISKLMEAFFQNRPKSGQKTDPPSHTTTSAKKPRPWENYTSAAAKSSSAATSSATGRRPLQFTQSIIAPRRKLEPIPKRQQEQTKSPPFSSRRPPNPQTPKEQLAQSQFVPRPPQRQSQTATTRQQQQSQRPQQQQQQQQQQQSRHPQQRQQRNQPANQHQQHQANPQRQQQQANHQKQQQQQQAGVGLAGPGTQQQPKFVSHLSGFIRSIQIKHAEAVAKEKERLAQSSGQEAATATTPLPKWRLGSGSLQQQQQHRQQQNLRDMRRRDPRRYPQQHDHRRQHHRRQHQAFDSANSNFMRMRNPRHQKSGAAVAGQQPADQTVTLPSFSVNLVEVSLLFREKTSELRNLLRRMGALTPEQQQGVDDEDIMVDPELMELIGLELGVPCERIERKNAIDDDILMQRRAAAEVEVQAYEALPPRPPVVTVMGHVDHGKTTLMDALRRRAAKDASTGGKKKKKKSKKDKKQNEKKKGGDIAGTEAGGITQVISAFQVPLLDEEQGAVTFLDTPGHAAFSAMRQSGSDAADIIVLVVAADDGVSKQTIEILDFYKSTVSETSNGISMVVAMNKIDKPGINVDESRARIESQLLEHGILVEGMPEGEGYYGSPVQLFPVSALKGEGLDDLIEGLALQSEIMDLRADDAASAEGIVMDARVEKGVGVVVDCIIRWGSINSGDIVVSGANMGKVRILKDVNGKALKKGTPSQPVRIVGFDSVPKAGESIVCVESEEVANDIVERRKALREAESTNNRDITSSAAAELQSSGKHMMHREWKTALEQKYDMDGEDSNTTLRIPVIVKADADGTLAALRDSLVMIGDESRHDIVIDPIKEGVGAVSASDIQLAKESGACVICFNLKTDQLVKGLAEEDNVPLLQSDIIYSLLDDAKGEFAKHLPGVDVEVVHGRGKVQAVFDIGGIDNKVAGLMVTEGSLHKDQIVSESGILKCQYRVLRKGKEVLTSSKKASSLKHFKEDVDSVSRGQECGLSLTGFDEYEEGDIIECFTIEEKHEFI